jgi:AraC family transcriptional regulator
MRVHRPGGFTGKRSEMRWRSICSIAIACAVNAPVAYRGGLPGYRLKRVLDYIGENLASDVSLSGLAAVVGMSPHYFAELFKKSTGRAPHQYILMQRIERAKQELYEQGRSVIDVGLSVGFQNPSRFARVFRKFVGVSPSRFQLEVQLTRRYYV